MGEYADEAISRMIESNIRLGDGYPPRDKVYRWEGGPPSHRQSHNCRSTVAFNLTERHVEEGEIARTPTNNVCPFCHKGGLHWSLVAGKNRLREEGGWLHHCAPVEGVTLSL